MVRLKQKNGQNKFPPILAHLASLALIFLLKYVTSRPESVDLLIIISNLFSDFGCNQLFLHRVSLRRNNKKGGQSGNPARRCRLLFCYFENSKILINSFMELGGGVDDAVIGLV